MNKHISVLKEECINKLNIKENGIYVDATLGGGGHSLEIVKRLKNGHLFCFDQDEFAINYSKDRLKDYSSNITFIKANFSNIKEELEKNDIHSIDGVLYDLGVSSFQLDIGERGFSYNKDNFLDMRMDLNKEINAHFVINNYSEEELKNIIFKYSDEKYAGVISKNIVKERKFKNIDTTFELVEIIKKSLPHKELSKKGHPAKKTFQALRVFVNDELNSLKKSLCDVIPMLNHDGRCLCITFQVDEDKIVKNIYKDFAKDKFPVDIPIKNANLEYEICPKKPILPSESELSLNNRSHSAKLRVLIKI